MLEPARASSEPRSQLASAGLSSSLRLPSPQMPLVLTFTDGLVKRLEELERTAELYKGRESPQEVPGAGLSWGPCLRERQWGRATTQTVWGTVMYKMPLQISTLLERAPERLCHNNPSHLSHGVHRGANSAFIPRHWGKACGPNTQ